MLIPVVPVDPRGILFLVACHALNQVEMCGSDNACGSEMHGSDSDCVRVKKWTVYQRLALTHMKRMVQVLHHEKVRETAITPLPIPMRWLGISENWDKDLPSEGMKTKVNRTCHVCFVSLGRRRLSRLLKCCLFYISYRARSRSRSRSRIRSRNSPTTTPHPWLLVSIRSFSLTLRHVLMQTGVLEFVLWRCRRCLRLRFGGDYVRPKASTKIY